VLGELLAEGLARLRVLDRGLVRRLRDPDALRRDPDAEWSSVVIAMVNPSPSAPSLRSPGCGGPRSRRGRLRRSQPHLLLVRADAQPLVLRDTRNAVMPALPAAGSVIAMTTYQSASPAFVIHAFAPSST
jgi:hypothetical protein